LLENYVNGRPHQQKEGEEKEQKNLLTLEASQLCDEYKMHLEKPINIAQNRT